MRSEEEIKKAIEKVDSNSKLSYSYSEDVINVLKWVLGDYELDGLGKEA